MYAGAARIVAMLPCAWLAVHLRRNMRQQRVCIPAVTRLLHQVLRQQSTQENAKICLNGRVAVVALSHSGLDRLLQVPQVRAFKLIEAFHVLHLVHLGRVSHLHVTLLERCVRPCWR